MKQTLSAQEIGQRIMELRKHKGLSQEDLAKSIGMSRPSLAQVELGNRGLDVLELQRLAEILGFSLDVFLSSNYRLAVEAEDNATVTEKQEDIRISVPKLQVAKFKNVLLYILERCAGKPNIGETALNKILYFCDFNYYERYEEHLTGAMYKKLQFGPVPQRLDSIIHQMIEKEELKRIKTEYHGFPQTRYLPLVNADLQQLSAAEKTIIDDVIQQMSDWNANKISEYSHKDIPWLATEDGGVIKYNLAFYRELPYSVRVYDEN